MDFHHFEYYYEFSTVFVFSRFFTKIMKNYTIPAGHLLPRLTGPIRFLCSTALKRIFSTGGASGPNSENRHVGKEFSENTSANH